MPEKPQDARQFIHDYLTNSGIGEKEALQREIKELKRIVRQYTRTYMQLFMYHFTL